MKLIFLVSGNGGNLKFINLCLELNYIKDCSLIVIADKNCGALEYAKKNGLMNYLISSYSRNSNNELLELLVSINPDIVITNFHKILDQEIVETFSGKLINLHYSLLPAYGGIIGEEPIIQAMNYSKFIGMTLHYVNEKVDSGKVIMQGIIKNEGSKNEIVSSIFKMGCFSILDYLFLQYPETKNKKKFIHNSKSKYIFSPDLDFNVDIFDEKFWSIVRDL